MPPAASRAPVLLSARVSLIRLWSSDVSAIFPSNVPVFRCSLPSTGSLGLVPPLPRYYKALRLPAAPPASLRFLRFAVPPLRLGLRSRGRKAQHAAGQGLFTGIPNTGFIDGDDRTSQVPGGPHYERALLFDPGGTSALGHCRASVLPSAKWTASAPTTIRNFGAQSHGPLTRCLRFAGWVAPPPRKTRFRMAGQPFRAGLVTRWVPTKGFRSSHSPFPGFAWRTPFAELKGEFALDVVPTNHYGANSAWLQLSILAHNLMRSFQLQSTLAMPKPRSPKRTYSYRLASIKTLRFLFINRAARLARISGRKVLRFSSNPPTENLYDRIAHHLAA